VSQNGDVIVFIINATPVPREGYRVGVSQSGFYEEILNTDAQTYGGSNLGNYGGCPSEEVPWQGRGHSLMLRLPPLALLGLKWRRRSEAVSHSGSETFLR
jgi:1,4-alpha-glucan branching enzyme